MRNIIKIDVFGVCSCALVANINDWTNSIQIMFENDAFNNPTIEILNGETTTTYDLDVVNGVAVYDFPLSNFTKPNRYQFRYVDGDKIGSWFTMINIDTVTILFTKTLKVIRLSEHDFRTVWVNLYETPVTSYDPEDFTVSDDGELSLKDNANVSRIIATDKGGKVINVTLKYDNDTQSSNDCTYDNDTGKLIKFGSLEIDWSYITDG